MDGSAAKKIAHALVVDPKSRVALLKRLVLDGFFDFPVSSKDVVLRIREKFGKRWQSSWIQVYLRRFMDAGAIQGVKPTGQKGHFWVVCDVTREDAIRQIGKGRKVQELEAILFSSHLMKRLETDFSLELAELHYNFGKHGNCTAFLLRKILEKLIVIVFTKNSKDHLLEDKNRLGGWIGLKDMIETAAREKLGGVPFLVPKTAREINGIKFLGDTAAHNPLTSVDMTTILPQMPFIITAYEELAARL
jgi:hypothetical protein